MIRVGIVDYGMGNLHSVIKAFRRLNIDVILTSDRLELEKCTHLLLPGVGHFKKGMENLRQRNLDQFLIESAQKKPLFGICLGMQLLTEHSEEGDVNGLGIIQGTTVQMRPSDERLRIPHMGWNSVRFESSVRLFEGLGEDEQFYFVHSYSVHVTNPACSLGTTNYGGAFDSVIGSGRTVGVQFHPEKSHHAGLTLLRNFIQYI